MANFTSRVAAPAVTFYHAAIQSYQSLSKTGDGKVSIIMIGVLGNIDELFTATLCFGDQMV